jgi:hypothetical protein
MSGRSYSIRGQLRPKLGSGTTPVNLQGKSPKPPKQPNRVPSSIAMKRYASQRG